MSTLKHLRIIGLTILVFLALAGATLVASGNNSLSPTSNLNQIIPDENGYALYRYTTGGVTCAGMVVQSYCDLYYDGNFDSTVDIYMGYPCATNAYPQVWLLYETFYLTSRTPGGRIEDGDTITPKLILNWACSLQVVANGLGNKKDLWADFLPTIKQAYP